MSPTWLGPPGGADIFRCTSPSPTTVYKRCVTFCTNRRARSTVKCEIGPAVDLQTADPKRLGSTKHVASRTAAHRLMRGTELAAALLTLTVGAV